MPAPSSVRPRLAIEVVVLLTTYNVVVNELLPRSTHGVAAIGTGALLLFLARRGGLTAADVGLDRAQVSVGLRWGVAWSAVLVAAIALLASTAGADRFVDDDLLDMSTASLVWEALVRIPVITAGFEELAFRGVLLASLVEPLGWRRGSVVHALLFGLWHILPTADVGVSGSEIAAAVAFTAVAGWVFAELRHRCGSLLAPFLVHWANNAAALVAAWVVTN